MRKLKIFNQNKSQNDGLSLLFVKDLPLGERSEEFEWFRKADLGRDCCEKT